MYVPPCLLLLLMLLLSRLALSLFHSINATLFRLIPEFMPPIKLRGKILRGDFALTQLTLSLRLTRSGLYDSHEILLRTI